MKTVLLPFSEVLAGYDAISALYPHIPPMCIWRGWEHAGYRRHQLACPVLDIGCGDGQVFRLLWPEVSEVVGVDMDASAVEAARASGVYHAAHQVAAGQMDRVLEPSAFASAFANCSLEHMDDLPRVMANVYRSLRPGGIFLFSVVTEKWLEWTTLGQVLELCGEPVRAADINRQHRDYHHLVNGLTVDGWTSHLKSAGFEVLEHMPIVPEVTARLVIFFDQLWHVPNEKSPTGEVGGMIHPMIMSLPNFPTAFRSVVEGMLKMERDPAIGAGAIFVARKNG